MIIETVETVRDLLHAMKLAPSSFTVHIEFPAQLAMEMVNRPTMERKGDLIVSVKHVRIDHQTQKMVIEL